VQGDFDGGSVHGDLLVHATVMLGPDVNIVAPAAGRG